MERFISLKDKGRNYLDTLTGKTVSKRQRDKAIRSAGSETPISNEKSAELNRLTNLELAVSRPARGRKGIKGLSEKERADIIAARIEDEKRKKEIADKEREDKKLARDLLKKANKKVPFKHFSDRILKPGSKGARLSFNTYKEYVTLAKEVKASGNVIAYSLGMVGYHEHTAQDYGITVVTLRSANDPPLSEDIFNAEFDEAREERTYFVFQHYFMHVAFKKAYYEKVYADYKARVKSGSISKRKVKSRRKSRK